MVEKQSELVQSGPSKADEISAQALKAMTGQIYAPADNWPHFGDSTKPAADFTFADGRTRHVTYDAHGAVLKIKDGGNLNHSNHLNDIAEWDRLADGRFMGVTERGDLPSTFTPTDKVLVQADGSIVLNLHKEDGRDVSAHLSPDGTDNVVIVDKHFPGYRADVVFSPQGEPKGKVVYPEGSQLTAVEENDPQGVSEPQSIRLESNGGAISIVKTGQGAALEARDPAGAVSRTAMTEVEFKDTARQWQHDKHLSIDWYKAGPAGARYDVVTDESGVGDGIERLLTHIKDGI